MACSMWPLSALTRVGWGRRRRKRLRRRRGRRSRARGSGYGQLGRLDQPEESGGRLASYRYEGGRLDGLTVRSLAPQSDHLVVNEGLDAAALEVDDDNDTAIGAVETQAGATHRTDAGAIEVHPGDLPRGRQQEADVSRLELDP